MAAWIRLQAERNDLVGEFSRVVNTTPDAPVHAFRVVVWRRWALAHGLTNDHVEAMLSEYARLSHEEKRAAYDKLRGSQPRAARAV